MKEQSNLFTRVNKKIYTPFPNLPKFLIGVLMIWYLLCSGHCTGSLWTPRYMFYFKAFPSGILGSTCHETGVKIGLCRQQGHLSSLNFWYYLMRILYFSVIVLSSRDREVSTADEDGLDSWNYPSMELP